MNIVLFFVNPMHVFLTSFTLLLMVVTQIRGHRAWFAFPATLRFVSRIFVDSAAGLFSFVDSRRIALTNVVLCQHFHPAGQQVENHIQGHTVKAFLPPPFYRSCHAIIWSDHFGPFIPCRLA